MDVDDLEADIPAPPPPKKLSKKRTHASSDNKSPSSNTETAQEASNLLAKSAHTLQMAKYSHKQVKEQMGNQAYHIGKLQGLQRLLIMTGQRERPSLDQ